MTWSLAAAGDRQRVARQLKAATVEGDGATIRDHLVAVFESLSDYAHADVVFVVRGGGHRDASTFNMTLSVEPVYVAKEPHPDAEDASV